MSTFESAPRALSSDGADRLDVALSDAAAVLARCAFPLPIAGSDDGRHRASRGQGQLDDYVLPRLRALDAPLLAVVGGSTGSGKSTLMNSLLGHDVTTTGVLRPTTRHPVLAHHPADRRWFEDDRILPLLPRVFGNATTPAGAEALHGVRLVEVRTWTAGLALLDAPDLDSVAADNRALAAVLMAAADLWLFVTTAARYADAVPWAALRAAAERDTAVALVLNRVPASAADEVTEHLRSLLAVEALSDAPVFVVDEVALQGNRLPEEQIGPLRRWVRGLADSADARQAVARRTVDGAVRALVDDLDVVAVAASEQVTTAAQRRVEADEAFAAAGDTVLADFADGALLRGEVLTRWQEFVGAGEVLQRLESGWSRLRDRIAANLRGQPVPPERATEAIEGGVVRVLLEQTARACQAVDTAWRRDASGLALLGGDDLARPSAQAAARAAETVRAWQADLVALVRAEGAGRRQTARLLAYGVNGVALALMVVTFSLTGGLTGAEVGIAGGASLLAQKLLETVFGEDAMRRMARQAQDQLGERTRTFLMLECRRFTDRVDALALDADVPVQLVSVAARIRAALPGDTPPAAVLPPVPAAQQQADAVRRRPSWRESLSAWWRGA